MSFDLRDYTWDIFSISRDNGLKSIQFAFKIFISNLNVGQSRYIGPNVDYVSLKEQWDKLPKFTKDKQISMFNKMIEVYGSNLCKAWREQDKFVFDSICIASKKESHRYELEKQLKEYATKKRNQPKKNTLKIKKF